ncbi:MAG: aminoacyl-tRNA hydrolase [Pirellulales bacterium]|nr:aminoacyl-tRNA hydrolase [Pirellulales bacterium]
MKLIVGLGNVGRKYEKTRHNVGFQVLDLLLQRANGEGGKERFDGRVTEVLIGSERVMLLWPHTLMNRSGQSVQLAAGFYQIPPSELLVVCDDFNLPLGKLRLRSQGSAGGQRGLEDIIRRLGTEEISRLRVGIGPVPEHWDAADFVLGKFGPSDLTIVSDAIQRAAEAAECWAMHGIESAMNGFNGAS